MEQNARIADDPTVEFLSQLGSSKARHVGSY
jgi:hypothetical protein